MLSDCTSYRTIVKTGSASCPGRCRKTAGVKGPRVDIPAPRFSLLVLQSLNLSSLLQKFFNVIPAKAGIQVFQGFLNLGCHRGDGFVEFCKRLSQFRIPEFLHLFAASGCRLYCRFYCRFWLPFCKAKSQCSTILPTNCISRVELRDLFFHRSSRSDRTKRSCFLLFFPLTIHYSLPSALFTANPLHLRCIFSGNGSLKTE